MRTVDPDVWSKNVKIPKLNVTRPMRFGVNELSDAEIRLRKSFHYAMLEFLRNSSVEGLGFVFDKGTRKLTRLLYLGLLLVTMIFGLFVVIWNIHWFWNRPRLMISLQTTQNQVHKINFPAVAICSFNLISRSSLHEYAKHLQSIDRNNIYDIEEIKDNLLKFRALHLRTQLPFDNNFVKYLENVVQETNITNILYRLSPKCESLLVRCSWRAHRVHCLQLFATRLSNVGYCCVFNARFDTVDRNNKPFKVNLVGEDAGLTVVVRENTDDFTYVRRLVDGVQVFLFDGDQFPLVSAGIVRSYTANRNASAFIKLNARAQKAASSLTEYSDDWLGCTMARDRDSIKHSWSRCVGQCRARAALALCQCTPHVLPPLDNGVDKPCSLEHIPCLAKHREKLRFLYPGDNVHESLVEEREDSVTCLHCRVGCERKRFSADLVSSPHSPDMFVNRFFKGLDLTNTTIISIYYGEENQRLFLVEPGLRWYEIVAAISSQCVFVVGVTLVSVMEFLYHLTFRWCHHYRRRWRRDKQLRKMKKPRHNVII